MANTVRKTCRFCHNEFDTSNKKEKCCSEACRSAAHKKSIKRYNASAKAKQCRRKYSRSAKGKGVVRKASAIFRSSEKGRASVERFVSRRRDRKPLIEVTCKNCGRLFNTRNATKKCHDKVCSQRWAAKELRRKAPEVHAIRNRNVNRRSKAIASEHFGWPSRLALSIADITIMNLLSSVGVPVGKKDIAKAIGRPERTIKIAHLMDIDLVTVVSKGYCLGKHALTILEERAREQEQPSGHQQDSEDRGDDGRATAAC